jgi:Predicted Fe-S protein
MTEALRNNAVTGSTLGSLSGALSPVERVRTPCIGVCSTGIGDSVCRGCKRFSHEIIDWNAYNEAEKRIVDSRLADFLSTCMQQKFVVEDPDLLRWQLDVQQVRFNPKHDPYCWLFSLLKAGATQIKDPAKYGFRVQGARQSDTLVELREQVDKAWWELSVAHYERYLATPDLFNDRQS